MSSFHETGKRDWDSFFRFPEGGRQGESGLGSRVCFGKNHHPPEHWSVSGRPEQNPGGQDKVGATSQLVGSCCFSKSQPWETF